MSASASAIVVDSAGRLCVWLSPRDFASTVMLGSVTADTVGRWAGVAPDAVVVKGAAE